MTLTIHGLVVATILGDDMGGMGNLQAWDDDKFGSTNPNS
jgi:hypothetical protein